MSRAMKDSGVAWIGEIPEQWSLHRMKTCIVSRESGSWGDEPVGDECDAICLRIADFDYARFRFKDTDTSELTQRHYSPDVIERLSLQRDDILIEKSGGGEKTPVGRTVIFDKPYQALYANFMDRLRCSTVVLPRFMQYVFVTFYKNEYTRNYIKQTTGIQNLDLTSMLASESIPVPPLPEQSRIAVFLDRRCDEIDRVIATTQRTIEEYKRLKQSFITEAVTHGVRGARKMKDSGVEWIGEIPEEWRTAKLKYFASIRSGITLGKVYPTGTELFEFPYLRVANVQGGHVKLDDIATIMVTKEESIKYRLQAGELLMTEGGDRDKLGRGTVWRGEIDPCLHQNHVFALNSDSHRLIAEYIEYLSTSTVGRNYFDVTANQSVHLASTNSTTILNFLIPYPPTDEQREIVSFINSQCTNIDQMIEAKQQLLTQMESYKKAVIYEYVTGKREVPN